MRYIDKISAAKASSILKAAIMVMVVVIGASSAYSRDIKDYAASSVLASGKWMKIEVSETGMHLITNAQLKKMGFNDPTKVNVYGYGGRPINEVLNAGHPDDLPMQPTVRTDQGLVFYAVDNVAWKTTSRTNMNYGHTRNTYSEKSCYFLSDAEVEATDMASEIRTPMPGLSGQTRYRARLLHEQDLAPAGNSGGIVLGEDFRTQTLRAFKFALPDNIGKDAYVNINFATQTTNGTSSIAVTANGTQLESGVNDRIDASRSDVFIVRNNSYKLVKDAGENLTLEIKYTPGGALYKARLDYIEVEYDRSLKLHDGELYFYNKPKSSINYTIAGCSAETQIWDVTDPAKPVRVEYTLTGSEGSFCAPEGYREFIAFNPASVKRAVKDGVLVRNQDLHALPVPDMLIISPQEYLTEAERLAQYRRDHDGLTVHVATPEQLYNEFSSGVPEVSAFRKALKMWYDRDGGEAGKMKYCLIFGRPTYDSKLLSDNVKSVGYPRPLMWQSITGTSQSSSYGTDDFIGMLEDDSAETFRIDTAKVSVAVGRMPVKSLAEARSMVDKIIKYETDPAFGSWRNQVMIIADDQDNAVHLDQAQRVYGHMRSAGNGENFLYERLYLDAYQMKKSGVGSEYPEAKARMMQVIREGVNFINYIGHASPRGWGHEHLLTWSDINSMTNTKLPVIYAATCEFGRWDDDEISGAEIMWLYPDSGVITFITPSRTVYISSNGDLNNASMKRLFERDADGRAKRLGDFYREGKNGYPNDDNKLRYCFFGDPSMRLASPELTARVEMIGETDITGAEEELPVIPALGKRKISGVITDDEGNVAEDFNGVLHAKIYDAEGVIETLCNGTNNPETRMYNDRKTRLYEGSVPVKDGRWELTAMLPSEISNNYSPALLSLYAYSDKGKEANGMTEKFYVYGYDDESVDDTTGPEVVYFTLNGEGFSNGSAVGSSPMVYGKLRDESGINISTGGIGHKLRLTLDGKQVYDDVCDYYTPDVEDPTAGSFSYPLSDLEPGEHTMTLSAWDNANNLTTASLDFKVMISARPMIYDLNTDVNPATTSVTFMMTHDRPSTKADCTIEVFDLGGRKVWSGKGADVSGIGSDVRISWDLTDGTGARVPRGIYLYRATVTDTDGPSTTMTKKLAVTAP